MAKRLKWSDFAKFQRREILKYWIFRNKSKTYSRKLNSLFNSSAKLISEFPEIGIEINDDCRGKLIRDFYIIYKNSENLIEIVAIWDVRQDPYKLEEILGL